MKKFLPKVISTVLVCSFLFGETALAATTTGGIGSAGVFGRSTTETTAAATESGVSAETQAKIDETTAAIEESKQALGGISKVSQNVQAGASFGTLVNQNSEEHPAILALEARIAGHSGLYNGVAILTNTENYVNIRTEASADSDVVGKIYNDSGAYIDDTVENGEGTWYKIHSGSCEGYVLADFFLTGKDAQDVASTVSTMYATVSTDSLRLRETPSLDGATVSVLSEEEEYQVIGDSGEFLQLKIDDDLTGYVLDEYVTTKITFKEAISIEEEQAELARQAELERQRREAEEQAARERQAAQQRSSSSSSSSSSSNSYSSGNAGANVRSSISSSRQSLVNYACSFVGVLPYVYGGNSLSSGTDCSGFVHMVFAAAGIGVGRTDVALRSAGPTVSAENMRPGDIVCYYGHVGIYIGNGTVVHCSTSSVPLSQQTKYSSWNYRSVVCVVNPWGD